MNTCKYLIPKMTAIQETGNVSFGLFNGLSKSFKDASLVLSSTFHFYSILNEVFVQVIMFFFYEVVKLQRSSL